MPIEYTTLDQGTFIYTRAYGNVQVADIVAHEQRLLTDPRVGPGYRQLLDCRWVSDDSDADDLLRSLADIHSRANMKLRGARYAVVAHGSQWFNLGSQYHCGLAGVTLIVFNDPGTACIWLGANYTELSSAHTDLPAQIPVSHVPAVVPAF